jgi:glucose/arabinose dehydrogenase
MTRKLPILMFILLTALSSNAFFASAAQAQRIQAEFDIRLIAGGLQFPWGMAFMPDGNLLVTERIGQLRIITPDGRISEPVKGVPAVFTQQQGGLLDVALDPEFSKNHLIYLSYAEPEGSKAGTAVAKAELKDGRLEKLQVIFRQLPKAHGGVHFGSRLAFSPDGNLFITLGDRGNHMDEAQQLNNHFGKIIRIRPDGSVPADNPFVKNPKAKPEIWSMAIAVCKVRPFILKRARYGFMSMAREVAMKSTFLKPAKITAGPKPVMAVITAGFPSKMNMLNRVLQNHLFLDAFDRSFRHDVLYRRSVPNVARQFVYRRISRSACRQISADDKKILGEEQLVKQMARFRDIEQGPDGALYLLTDEDNGKLLKITPKH